MLFRFLFILSVSLANCPQQSQNTEDVLVKAYGNQLTTDDIDYLLDNSMAVKDSAIVIQRAIDNWLMDQILYSQAKSKIKNTDELEALVDDYRKSIYIHEFQELSLKEGIEFNITDAEVDSYLAANHEAYPLEERIVRVMLAKLPVRYDSDQLESIWATEDIAGLEALITEGKGLSYTNVDEWHTVSHIKDLLPTTLIDRVNFGGTKSYKEKTDTEIILLKIIEDSQKGELAPPSYIKERIKQELLLNKKKIFLNNLNKTLYQNNIQSKDIHIYN